MRTTAPFSVRGHFRHSERDSRERRETPYQSSLVRVLHDGDQLEAARQRAIESERLVIESVKARISHYEEMGGHAVVIQMPEAASPARTAPEARASTA